MTNWSVPAVLIAVVVVAAPASAAEPFVQESCPSPGAGSRLADLALSPSGRVVVAGETRELPYGGSPFHPLVLEKPAIDGAWQSLDAPSLGETWHSPSVVLYLPESGLDEDLVVVGDYLPDPLLGYPDGMVLRYHRATASWDVATFAIPGYLFLFVADATLDPDYPDRLLIAGTKGIDDGAGFCFRFEAMLVESRISTGNITVLPTTMLGALSSIVPLGGGHFLMVGRAADECDVLPYPLVLEWTGSSEIVRPNPPPHTPGAVYSLFSALALPGGGVFAVGVETPNGGSHFSTLGYRYDPIDQSWQEHKPLDPDQSTHPAGFTNQLYALAQAADGRIFSAGRSHYIDTEGLHHFLAMIQSFDGSHWRLHPVPDELSQGWGSQAGSILATTAGDVVSVGLYDSGDLRDRTLVLRATTGPAVFGDGFDGGDASLWSATVP